MRIDKHDLPSARMVGRRVRRLREARGISAALLGERSGFTQQQISQVELGRINTPIETLAKLAEGLGVRLRDLFEEEPAADEQDVVAMAALATQWHEVVNEHYNVGHRLTQLEDQLSQLVLRQAKGPEDYFLMEHFITDHIVPLRHAMTP